jgi:SIR2-like domain
MQLYDEIYNIAIRNDHKFPNATGGIALQVFSSVATVNYDLVLEIYGRQTNVAGVPKFFTSRGFRDDDGIQVLNVPLIREGSNNPDYIKLHGSIDWWLDDSHRVISSLVGPENPFEVLTERTIIYPIYEKHITRDPFFTLYEYFRRRLFREDIIIVIGYSFRDLTINNAFSDWLASKPESRLIITARKENHEVIRRIIDNDNDKKHDKIQFIHRHFGEAGFITDLENTLNTRPC